VRAAAAQGGPACPLEVRIAGALEDVAHSRAEIAHRQCAAHGGIVRVGDHAIVLRHQFVIFVLVEIAEPRGDDIQEPPGFPASGVHIAAGLLQADKVGQRVQIIDGVVPHFVEQFRLFFRRRWRRRLINGLGSRRLRLRQAGGLGRHRLQHGHRFGTGAVALQRFHGGQIQALR